MSSISKLKVGYNNVFRNLLGYGRRDSASSMFAINAIYTYEARMRKAYFIFRQILMPTHGGDIITCGSSGIILYIFVITIEFFTLLLS